MTILQPPLLKQGDTIGIISPSLGLYPFVPHRLNRAIECIESLGFHIKLGKTTKTSNGYVSGTIEDRVDDIHKMFLDNEVKAIITTIGGNHCNQLLKHINYSLIRRNPKIFIGFSDITVLHYAFLSQANLKTFYGPQVMTQFGENPELQEYTLQYFKNVLFKKNRKQVLFIKPSDTWTDEFLDWTTKEDQVRPRKYYKNNGYRWLREGKSEGKLLGGCLQSINHLQGTKYWVDPKNSIFFLDIPEGHDFGKGMSLADIDSYFADLDNLDVFSSINALIIGRPIGYSLDDLKQFESIIMKYTSRFSYPIVCNVNIGHTDPIATFPYTSFTKINSEKNHIIIQV